MIARITWFALVLPSTLLAADRAIPGYEGETKKVLDRALEQYRSAKTYQDGLIIKVDVDAENDELVRTPPEPFECTLAWAGPNRIALDTPGYQVFCDGKTLWEQNRRFEQYAESPAPKRIDPAKLAVRRFPIYEQIAHPIVSVIGFKSASVDDLFGKVAELTGTKAEVRAGRPGRRVSGALEQELPDGGTVKVTFAAWFDGKTGLLEEIRYDHTAHIRRLIARSPNPGGLRINKYLRHFRFEKVALNGQKIPDGTFVFKPGTYDEKVSQLRVLTVEEWQQRLIGRPAPSFSGKDLEGKGLIFADLRGRVVLLDFWASFCAPCIMAMPSLQRLADQLADKPVSIIGINGDPPAQKRWLKVILQRQRVRYRQYVDANNEVFTAYRVQPIPCLVLIGKKGVIQAIHTGLAPGQEKQLADQIARLLNGENLFGPKTPVPDGAEPAAKKQ